MHAACERKLHMPVHQRCAAFRQAVPGDQRVDCGGVAGVRGSEPAPGDIKKICDLGCARVQRVRVVEDDQAVPAVVLRHIRGGDATAPANAAKDVGGGGALGVGEHVVGGQLLRDPALERRVVAATGVRAARAHWVE